MPPDQEPRSPSIDSRALAAAVLRQAWRDAQFHVQPAVRRGAAAWLLSPHNRDRQFWADAAGLNDRVVTETARRALRSHVA